MVAGGVRERSLRGRKPSKRATPPSLYSKSCETSLRTTLLRVLTRFVKSPNGIVMLAVTRPARGIQHAVNRTSQNTRETDLQH